MLIAKISIVYHLSADMIIKSLGINPRKGGRPERDNINKQIINNVGGEIKKEEGKLAGVFIDKKWRNENMNIEWIM